MTTSAKWPVYTGTPTDPLALTLIARAQSILSGTVDASGITRQQAYDVIDWAEGVKESEPMPRRLAWVESAAVIYGVAIIAVTVAVLNLGGVLS